MASFIETGSRSTEHANERFIYFVGINAEHSAPVTPVLADSKNILMARKSVSCVSAVRVETPPGKSAIAVDGHRVSQAYTIVRRRRHPSYHTSQYLALALLPLKCTRDMFGQTELDIYPNLRCPNLRCPQYRLSHTRVSRKKLVPQLVVSQTSDK
jgi:hypothetical protein